ncbi:hypothetical protein BS46_gp07 [Acinetobacter phage BS46]|nr:hypothetical protein BS46_gp07 [Acinetobacter phage BS46]
MSSMLNALLAAHKKNVKASDKVGSKTKKVKKTNKEELFDYSILEKGGVSQYTFTYEGKKKTLFVSCHTRKNNTFPKYKFHIKSALDHRFFIKAKDFKTAQALVDDLFGAKKYTVSGSML